MADSIANKARQLSGCPCGVYKLTEEQTNAMHNFELRFIAGLHRVYTEVDQETADKIIGEMLKRLADQL